MPFQTTTTKDATCLFAVGSVTQAMHAKEVLARSGIAAMVVRNDPSFTKSGCTYAISYPCRSERTVRSLLHRAGIHTHGGGRI